MKKYSLYLLILLGIIQILQAQKIIYKNPSIPAEKRAEDLLSQMTLEEKLAQLSQTSVDGFKGNAVKRFSLDKFKNGMGAVDGFILSAEEYAGAVNLIQKYLKEKTRLGIPAIFVSECLHGLVQDGATIFPQAIAMGSSWNTDLIKEVGLAIREEVKSVGCSQVLGPDLDIARELRWGRVEETYGEDPYLISRIGSTMVKALQEGKKPDSISLIATAKHFLGYCAPIGGLNLASTAGGKYDIYNTYLPSFKAAIQEGSVLSVMSVYSSYDGEALNASKEIYTDLLRKELGFKGYVYSDWGTIGMLNYFHKTAKNKAEAGKLALIAGIDLEAPTLECYQYLDSLVKNKMIDVEYINHAVKRILLVKFKSGLFENPYVDPSLIKKNIHSKEHIDLAKKLADESIILLKNEKGFLPLDMSKIKSIAVIGPNADQVQFGDYTWSRSNKDGVTLLEGLKKVTDDKISLNYAKGCDMVNIDKSGFAEAIKAAEKSDIAIVAIGTASASLSRDYTDVTCGEGYDVCDLNPSGVQEELVKAIYATGKPTIIVLIQGRPFSIPWIKENIPAIVEAWYPGEMGGISIAEVLFGKVNPSGKLPVSFPKSAGHLPCYYNYLPSDKGFYKQPGKYGKPGRDYVFSDPYSLWPFGFGLCYTEFELSDFHISNEKPSFNDIINISVNIKNTGKLQGKEVVQLYINQEYSSVIRPVKELKGFKKIDLRPGETKKAEIFLKLKDCGYYNNKGKYLLEPGNFTIMLGTSSEDIKFKKIIEVR